MVLHLAIFRPFRQKHQIRPLLTLLQATRRLDRDVIQLAIAHFRRQNLAHPIRPPFPTTGFLAHQDRRGLGFGGRLLRGVGSGERDGFRLQLEDTRFRRSLLLAGDQDRCPRGHLQIKGFAQLLRHLEPIFSALHRDP